MYLLDTNALICALFTPDRLSPLARKTLEESKALSVSVVSLWENLIPEPRPSVALRRQEVFMLFK